MIPLWQLCKEGKLDKVRLIYSMVMIITITITNSITTTIIIIIISILNNVM